MLILIDGISSGQAVAFEGWKIVQRLKWGGGRIPWRGRGCEGGEIAEAE